MDRRYLLLRLSHVLIVAVMDRMNAKKQSETEIKPSVTSERACFQEMMSQRNILSEEK